MPIPVHRPMLYCEPCGFNERHWPVAPTVRIAATDRCMLCGTENVPVYRLPEGSTLTLEQRVIAALWMVGNNDTEHDKAAWWRAFRETYEEFSEKHKDVSQYYADIMNWDAGR